MPLPQFPDDGSVAATPQISTVSRVDLYVNPNASNASDSNVGSQAEPLLTFDEAIGRINKITILGTDAPIVVHLATYPSSPTGDGYTWTRTLHEHRLRAPIVFIGDGAGEPGDDGFTELLSAVAQAGTSNTAIESVGLVVDAYHGKTLEMTGGLAAGFRRTVRNNDADTIFPIESFAVGPVAGDAFRIVEPSVVVQLRSFTINGATLGYDQPITVEDCGRARPGNNTIVSAYGSRSYVAFVNMKLISDAVGNRCQLDLTSSSVALFGVEIDGSVNSVQIHASRDATLMCGMDLYFSFTRAQLAVDLAIASDIRAWGGWSAFFTTSPDLGAFAGAFRGSLIADGAVTFYNADLGIFGTSIIGSAADALLGAFQQCFGQIGGTSHVLGLLRNSNAGASSHSLGVNGGSIVNCPSLEIEKTGGGGACVYAYSDDSGQGSNPALVSLDTVTLTGSGSPAHAVVVAGGSQITYSAITITGGFSAGTQAAVLNPDIAGAVVQQQDFSDFSDGETLPLPATSDGRDGFIRRG